MKIKTKKYRKLINCQRLEKGNRNKKKTYTHWGNYEHKNLSKWTGPADTTITNRIKEMEERILGVEDMIEEIDLYLKENFKSKKFWYKTDGKSETEWKDQTYKI